MITTLRYRPVLRVLVLAATGVLMLGTLAGCDPRGGSAGVKAAFEQMKTACESRDGQSAIKIYNQATFEHYGKVVKLALDGDFAAVMSQPPTTVVEILGIRSNATRAQIEPLDGKRYIAFAVDSGWWEESLDGLAVRDIKISGDFATATAHYPEWEKQYQAQQWQRSMFGGRRRSSAGGKPPTYTVKFVKEQDGWKYDELSLLAHQDRELNTECNQAKMPMRDFLMEICSEDTERLPMSIWEPMPKKK